MTDLNAFSIHQTTTPAQLRARAQAALRHHDALVTLRTATASHPDLRDALAALLPERLGGVSFAPQGLADQIQHALRDTIRWNHLAAERDRPTPRPGTRFPTDLLPAVPEDRWNAEKVSDTTVDDDRTATTVYTLDAPTADEAERRLLAWISHNYQDDLNGATATATRPSQPGNYTVYLTQPVRY